MTNVALAFLAVVWPPIAVWLMFLVKMIPSSFQKYIEKEIERRSDAKLEYIKGEIQGSYSTLKSSVDMLSASSTGLHPHIIEAVSEIWATMLNARPHFIGLITFDTMLLASEANDAFKEKEDFAHFLAFVRVFEGDLQNPERLAVAFPPGQEKNRLFCGDRLWLIFYVFQAILIRSALLISGSFKKGEYQDWRKDGGIKQLLNSVFPSEYVVTVLAKEFGGIQDILGRLEAEFLHESTRVMSGSKAMADSLADMQAVMLLHNAQIANQRQART